jgi:hypothetical protein
MNLSVIRWGKARARRVLSMRTRTKIAWSRVELRRHTGRFRILPNLLIIGAQRCGTSSLYKYLGRHPEIAPALRKETRYFTEYFDKGDDWYRAHFPLHATSKGRIRVAFEATPDYLLDLRCSERAAGTLGECKVIVLLRDPVERAFSHYLHHRRLGQEPLSFEAALDEEERRLAPHLEALRQDPDAPLPMDFLRYSYATRGRYAEQLEPWLSGSRQWDVSIIEAEQLFRRPLEVYEELMRFLGVSYWVPEDFQNHSYSGSVPTSRQKAEMSDATRSRLEAFYREPNRRLEMLLGRSFDWTG